jgi:CDP-glucose 4,6-dehydratase
VIRSPNAVRPWQHVLEPVLGYLLLGERLLGGDREYAKAYNFGPDPSGFWKVSEILDLAKKIWPEFDYSVGESSGHEAGLLTLDSKRAHEELKWQPRLKVDQALQWTLDWYRANILEDKILTGAQIEEFFDLR